MKIHPLFNFPAPPLLVRLPPDWQIALAACAKYYGWSRADAWDCTLQELRWWVNQMNELEKSAEDELS